MKFLVRKGACEFCEKAEGCLGRVVSSGLYIDVAVIRSLLAAMLKMV